MGQFTENARDRIGMAVTEPNQAVDIVSVIAVITAIREIVKLCMSRGASKADVAHSLAAPNFLQRWAFRAELKKHVGKKKYRQLGGWRYADKAMKAGATAELRERVGFVDELARG